MQKVAVLGASDDPTRYSYKAIEMLRSHGHQVIPIHPKLQKIQDLAVLASLTEISESIDTLTLYVGEKISTDLKQVILQLKPKRIIFNPGAENSALLKAAQENKIEALEACTLVMLRTGQF